MSSVCEYRSSLPDPWPVLDESEKSFVKNITSMGFPQPRVSRAVQRLGMKDSEVMCDVTSTLPSPIGLPGCLTIYHAPH